MWEDHTFWTFNSKLFLFPSLSFFLACLLACFSALFFLLSFKYLLDSYYLPGTNNKYITLCTMTLNKMFQY